jgi:ankyrin repeat protein
MAKVKPDEHMLQDLRHAIEADAPSRLEPSLRAGVPVDQRFGDDFGTTLLGLAIEKNAIGVAKFLIGAGAKLERGPNKPLVQAALYNRKEIAQLLLEAGANPNATVRDPDEGVRGETALMNAIDLPEKIEMVEVLLKHGANPSLANSKGETALFQAVDYANLQAVRVLLAAGCKPSGPALLPRLVYRCTADSLEILKLLLGAGADVNKPGNRDSHYEGYTALEAAMGSYKEKTELIEELSCRRREDWEEKHLERWKAEAQIFQAMIDALSRAEALPANTPHAQRDTQ